MPTASYDIHQCLIVLYLSIVVDMKSVIFTVSTQLMDNVIYIGIGKIASVTELEFFDTGCRIVLIFYGNEFIIAVLDQ